MSISFLSCICEMLDKSIKLASVNTRFYHHGTKFGLKFRPSIGRLEILEIFARLFPFVSVDKFVRRNCRNIWHYIVKKSSDVHTNQQKRHMSTVCSVYIITKEGLSKK